MTNRNKRSRSNGFRWLAGWLVTVLVWQALSGLALGGSPRALPEGQLPADQRLQPLRDLNGYFPFQPPVERAEWELRSEQVRRRMQVALGLWPLPEPTPPHAVIHGRIEMPDYTVEKVYFESLPGLFVTGNLYRPRGVSGRVPGVLSPHGHWSQGRFHDAGRDAVRRDIVRGAERFEEGGRHPLQARCVQLARMGCVVFHYDMLGYADSQQISYQIAHRFAEQRPEMNHPEEWGLYSPQAESQLQSVMGLQTYISIRALDFLESLPDVDPTRLAVTGASGGGTQTFILGALDSRVRVGFPAVMVSTAMQGGCVCENACLLRIGVGNVDFAALFAPRPQALTAADDWTREMETKGFPELRQLYELLGAPDHVRLHPYLWFGHNFNYVNRAAMYDWFNRHLELGLPVPIVEEAYTPLTPAELTVWNEEHPAPPGGDDFERDLLSYWKADTDRQLAAARPQAADGGERFRELIGAGLEIVIGRSVPAGNELEFHQTAEEDHSSYRRMVGLLRHRPAGEELPVVLLVPEQAQPRTAIWLSVRGKSGLFQESGEPVPEVAELLARGLTVLGVDLIYQGEFLAADQQLERTRRVDNPRESAAYTFGYNHTVFAQRVHDVLSVVAYARQRGGPEDQLLLFGLDGSGPWAAAALGQAAGEISRAVVATGGFRFAAVDELHSPDFLPGGAKYFDLPGMLALAAPLPLWLAGETAESAALIQEAYAAAGRPEDLQLHSGELSAAAIAEWIGETP